MTLWWIFMPNLVQLFWCILAKKWTRQTNCAYHACGSSCTGHWCSYSTDSWCTHDRYSNCFWNGISCCQSWWSLHKQSFVWEGVSSVHKMDQPIRWPSTDTRETQNPEHPGGPKISKTWTLSPRSEQQDSSRSWTDQSIGCKSKLEGLLYTKYLFNEALHTRAGRWYTCTTLSLDDISSFCFQFLRKAYLHPPDWHLGNTALLYPCCSSFCALNRQELQKQRPAAIKVSHEN